MTIQLTPGDLVEIIIKHTDSVETVSGTVLQRAAIFDPSIVILKLTTGYNIGIKKDTIVSSKVIEPYKKPVMPASTHAVNPALPTVALLSFGGTISSKVDYRTGGVVAGYTAQDFYDMIPELSTIANIRAKHCMQIMSEDMTTVEWSKMASEIAPLLNDSSISGIVVTQGTDTLHYSTSAMSFALGKLSKPVVFTAAQRSIDRGSSDAFLNLLCAVKAAASWNGASVVTCMHESSSDDSCILVRGTKVRKMHTSRRDSFRPINEQALARIQANGNITPINTNHAVRNQTNDAIDASVKPIFDPHVGLLLIHPGISPKIVDYFISNGYKGLVVAATALGHVPLQMLEPLARARKGGMHIVVASQTIYGRVHPNVYSRLRDMSIGAQLLFASDMLVETAFTKLSWLIANEPTRVEELFLTNMHGELVLDIDEKSYLN
ncbi:MAG TPA: Glu-tRNA(Gln) amidotransferase subunit GatD [Acidobacteriota bacterium]|nr:Glu-tRNA(Gln) amidotransferase subunit GatD [Acidobacteriota bacterium]